jgi:hypothetical protein
MNVYVVHGESESNDEYVAVFSKKPTKKLLKNLAFSWDGDRDNPTAGGYAGSYVYISVEELVVDEYLNMGV